MPSVVIAAHDEESVIGACLDALLGQGVEAGEIVVVANGCTDRTAAVARERGVVVVDLPEPGKAAALNAGDAAAVGYPRVYLDADIVLPHGAMRDLAAVFDSVPTARAVVPRRRVNTRGRQWPVRAYFAINTRLPAFEQGLFGRGVVALSAEGRDRFDVFPILVADDLFLDAQFGRTEKVVTPRVEIVIDAPFTTRELVRRLVRVRRGNAELRAAAAAGDIEAQVRASQRWEWLRVSAGHPTLWFSAATYAVITLVAGSRARRSSGASATWGRDASTRERARSASDAGAS